ncbi:hypothetical protein Ahy_B06g085513 [Arachis hypogaea]|uniref:Uncharacterized protein n=1 Tax=Arachis hypogaea TaxID=3818 RepID=A0A444YUT9_ARAHY|nr:hypothetical protein Ahy_B06g085513 [Arachis hypogaea]
MEENDLFLCASSFFFINAMQGASLFSSLEAWLDAFSAHRHIDDAISRACNELISELCEFGTKYRKKFGFEFLTTTDRGHSHKILEEVKKTYLAIALEPIHKICRINSGGFLYLNHLTFSYILPGARTTFWLNWILRIYQDKIQEETEETGEVVQDSLEEEVVPNNSSDEVVSSGPKDSMMNYDLNKTPEENERF